jgi:putative hydrolase of the HAD superfamily
LIKAILLDVDGTLYDQSPLRRRMLWDLVKTYWMAPGKGWKTARILQAYRRAQESLRGVEDAVDLAEQQLRIVQERTACDRAAILDCVLHWMDQAPLRHLEACLDPAVSDFLKSIRARGISLAVCSDYPAKLKLQAMGLEHFFDCVVCAGDDEVGRLKPHPRIIEVALQRLGVAPEEAVYIGDRPDIDGDAAKRAGVRYVNIIRGNTVHSAAARRHGSMTFPELLRELL